MTALPSPWSELAGNAATGNLMELDRLTLSLRQGRGECWIEYGWHSNGTAEEADRPRLPPKRQSQRFLMGEGEQPVTLAPRLADRAVVARPLQPTELLPRQQATLLVSTSLWAHIGLGELTLQELPTSRLSDTWFGADTRRGELCYASRTLARQRLDNLPPDAFRAITRITIDNDCDTSLKLERINVPVPHLTLYSDGERFWTSALTIARSGGRTDTANLRIEPRPPEGAASVTPPRRPIRGGVFDRALDLLFA